MWNGISRRDLEMSNYFFLTLPDKACCCTEIPIFKVVDMTVRILADNLHVNECGSTTDMLSHRQY